MNVRLVAALATAAVCMSGAAGSAQTTMAPTPAPMVGPSAAPGLMTPSSGVQSPAPRPVPMPSGPLALDARYLHGARTLTGYRLTGQAEVKDACTAARFSQLLGNIFPPYYNLVQYRRPGTQGLLCIQRLTWVTIQPLNVTSTAPPRWVTVHTHKASTRVPILPGPVR